MFCLVILPTLLVRGCALRPARRAGPTIRLYLSASGRVVRMGLEDYLVGVVAAEMPANFSPEALKAQAVAARTLTVKRLRCLGGRGCSHRDEADICDQPGDGQAWYASADLKRIWGQHYRAYHQRIARAVAATRGLILLHEGQPIDALYHSTCGGRTEDAANVWGEPIPYLRGVTCGFDQISPRYRSTVSMTRAEAASRLGLALPAAAGAGAPFDLRILGRTPAGRVAGISVAGKTMRGEDFRHALGLRSADFTWKTVGESIVFEVKGYGHRVGMCQYGAEGMARQGANYRQILGHYYSGVRLGRIKE